MVLRARSRAARSIRTGSGPAASNASISMRSPTFMNGVDGLPCSIVSIMRRSARHDTPRARSAFDTVPLPRIVPAVNRRVFATCCDQIEEREVHLGAGVAVADELAVVGRAHADVDAAVAPRGAELVGRDRERRERGRRLRLEEAEALGQLVGDQVAQRDVVREHDQAHVLGGGVGARCRCGTSPRITQTSRLEVEAPRGIVQHDRIARRRADRPSRPGRRADRSRASAAAPRRAPCAPG